MPKAGLARDWDDHRLIVAMRTADRGAFEEFFERFAPMLREEASRLRIQPAYREEAVVECLERAVMLLVREHMAMPSSLAAYLAIRLARAEGSEVLVVDPQADKRAMDLRKTLTPAEAMQTSVDAAQFGNRIRGRIGQRRPPPP